MSNDYKQLRIKTVKALAYKLSQLPNESTPSDYMLCKFYREITGLPARPPANPPLSGLFPATKKPKRLFAGLRIPEEQLRATNYKTIKCDVLGIITITGGFMEPQGHSSKPSCLAIDEHGNMNCLPPANRNLGIDYCNPYIRAWYDGKCTKVRWEKGYGLRAYFDWGVSYPYKGEIYPVCGAFAHAASIKVIEGEEVEQGQFLGVMGNSGGNYAPHIDYRQWLQVGSQKIDLSPNALEKYIHE